MALVAFHTLSFLLKVEWRRKKRGASLGMKTPDVSGLHGNCGPVILVLW